MGEKETKEINLLDILNIIGKGILNLIKLITNFIGTLLQLSVKHAVLFLSVLFLSIVIGQYSARPSKRKYKAGAVALLYGTDASTAREVCKQIQFSIPTNVKFSLSQKLTIPDSVAKNIVDIQAFNVIDYLKDKTPDMIDFKHSRSLSDTASSVMNDRIYIQVITKKITQVPIIKNALLNFFNNNTMMRNQFETEKNNLLDRIRLCDNELNRIDSLAKVSYFKDTDKKISFENNQLIVGEQKKQLFYEDILHLQNIKASTKNRLVDFRQPLDFPTDLVINPEPINNPIKCGIFSIILGTILGFLLVFIFENLKRIIRYLTNKS